MCVRSATYIAKIMYGPACVKGQRDVCAFAKSCDLSVRSRKQLHIWNLRPKFTYALYNPYWATMTVKGRLQVIMSTVKAVFVRKFVPLKMGPKMAILR